MKQQLKLSLNDDTFSMLKNDFDSMLNRTLYNMEAKHSDEAEVTAKLKIILLKDTATDESILEYDAEREIIRPKFEHKISTIISLKDTRKGQMEGEFEMVYDKNAGGYVLRPLSHGQLSFDDLPEQSGKAVVDASYNVQDMRYPQGEVLQLPATLNYTCCRCLIVDKCENAHKLSGDDMQALNGLCGVVDGESGLPCEPIDDENNDNESLNLGDLNIEEQQPEENTESENKESNSGYPE